mmetsp:Transcript_48263/g.121551  ORF Transcript_48263/g.121551 Transcript_48263/m.121551 type:complete len:206 (+) Transcript_48263:1359-1976(+)
MSASHLSDFKQINSSIEPWLDTGKPAIPTGDAFTKPAAPSAAWSAEDAATTAKLGPANSAASSAARGASESKMRTSATPPNSQSDASTARAMPPAPRIATTSETLLPRCGNTPTSANARWTPKQSVLWPMSLARGAAVRQTSTTFTAPTATALASTWSRRCTTSTLQGIVTLTPAKPTSARPRSTEARAAGSLWSTPVRFKSINW